MYWYDDSQCTSIYSFEYDRKKARELLWARAPKKRSITYVRVVCKAKPLVGREWQIESMPYDMSCGV